MPKILSMCSSRNRPKELIRMLESFDNTRTLDTEIVVYVSLDDPHLHEYIDVLRGRRWLYFIGPHKYMVQVLNFFSTEMFPDCEFYQEVNDDHIYHTVGWDKKLSDAIVAGGGAGCSWAFNGIDQYNSANMVSGNVIRAVGYFNSPLLYHHYADGQMRSLFEEVSRQLGGKQMYFFVPDVLIEHRCWHNLPGKEGTLAPPDDNTRWIYNAETDLVAQGQIKEWDINHKVNDAAKLVAMIGNLQKDK